jgi:putative phage-type endonuclease
VRGGGVRTATVLLGTAVITAVPVVRFNRTPKDRARWLKARQQSLGASDVAAAIGVPGAYTSPFALWWAKQPDAPAGDPDMTEEQEWGLRLEAAIAGKFAEQHPELYVIKPPACMYRHPDEPWITASPDRLTIDHTTGALAPLELKTDQNPARWDAESFPDMYRVQLAWQCIVLGVFVGYLAALVGKRYREYRVEFTAEYLNDLLAAAETFWKSLDGEPPDIDAHDSTRAVLLRLNADVDADQVAFVGDDLADEYEQACDELAAVTARRETAVNRMLAAMGTAGRAITSTGREVASRRRYTRRAYTVAASQVDALWRTQQRGSSP